MYECKIEFKIICTNLIENRSKTTDEGVHAKNRFAIDILIRMADVEDLAVVVGVGVVTERALGATAIGGRELLST